MSTSLSGLSAAVTRILFLTGFPKELKTKDIQAAFSEWDNINGGFKIKWRDDTSLLIVFQDASIAKRAYLQTLAYPPTALTNGGVPAIIKPYDGPDAQDVIQNVAARGQHNPNNPSRAHNNRSNSISVFPAAGNRVPVVASNFRPNGQNVVIPDGFAASEREPSPTLPNIPAHPTLNSLINSTLGEVGANSVPSDPAILATSLNQDMSSASGGPRIGDPGKRMLGAALGVRHPSLGPRMNGGSPGTSPAQGGGVEQAMREVQRAMGGLVVAE